MEDTWVMRQVCNSASRGTVQQQDVNRHALRPHPELTSANGADNLIARLRVRSTIIGFQLKGQRRVEAKDPRLDDERFWNGSGR